MTQYIVWQRAKGGTLTSSFATFEARSRTEAIRKFEEAGYAVRDMAWRKPEAAPIEAKEYIW